MDDAFDSIAARDDAKRHYLSMAVEVLRLYKAILPDEAANEFIAIRATIAVIAEGNFWVQAHEGSIPPPGTNIFGELGRTILARRSQTEADFS